MATRVPLGMKQERAPNAPDINCLLLEESCELRSGFLPDNTQILVPPKSSNQVIDSSYFYTAVGL